MFLPVTVTVDDLIVGIAGIAGNEMLVFLDNIGLVVLSTHRAAGDNGNDPTVSDAAIFILNRMALGQIQMIEGKILSGTLHRDVIDAIRQCIHFLQTADSLGDIDLAGIRNFDTLSDVDSMVRIARDICRAIVSGQLLDLAHVAVQDNGVGEAFPVNLLYTIVIVDGFPDFIAVTNIDGIKHLSGIIVCIEMGCHHDLISQITLFGISLKANRQVISCGAIVVLIVEHPFRDHHFGLHRGDLMVFSLVIGVCGAVEGVCVTVDRNRLGIIFGFLCLCCHNADRQICHEQHKAKHH